LKVFEAADIKNADKAAAATLAQGVLSSLAKHDGKGVQRANEGKPAKWRLAP
jgi:ribosomal protein S20